MKLYPGNLESHKDEVIWLIAGNEMMKLPGATAGLVGTRPGEIM